MIKKGFIKIGFNSQAHRTYVIASLSGLTTSEWSCYETVLSCVEGLHSNTPDKSCKTFLRPSDLLTKFN